MVQSSDIPLINEQDLATYVQPKFHSITWRLLVYFFFLSILPISIIGYSMIQNSEYLLATEIENKIQSVAIAELSEVNFALNESKMEFSELPLISPELVDLGLKMLQEKDLEQEHAVREELNKALSHSRHISEIFLVGLDAPKIMTSTNTNSKSQMLSQNYFNESKKRLYVEPLHYSERIGTYVLNIGMPLESDNGNLLGVLGGRIKLENIYDFLADRSDDVGLGNTGETYIVNQESHIISGIGYNAYYQNLSPQIRQVELDKYMYTPIHTEGIDRALNGERGISVYNNHTKNAVIGYYDFLPEFGFAFLLEQSIDEAFQPIGRMKWVLGWIIILVLIVDIMLAFVIDRGLAKPINRLANSAKQIAAGDYEALAEVTSYDEFGLLAQAFNKMSESLILNLDETNNIIEVMPNALFILDIDGKIRSINQSATELSKYNKAELMTMMFKDLICHEDHPEHESKGIFDLNKLKEEEKIVDFEMSFFTKYHKCLPASFSGAVLKNKQKKIIGYIMIIKDLSQIKSSELKLQKSHGKLKKEKEKTDKAKVKTEALLESIGEGLIAIDLQGGVMIMNQKTEEMFGRPLSDVIGRHYTKSFKFEDPNGRPIESDIFSVSGSVLTDQKIIFFITSDGQKLPLSVTVSPIIFESRSIGNIVIFRDISKEMEVDKAKSEFVSLASHQLRTPLTGIKWLLQEVFRKGGFDDLQTEYLEDAMSSNDRMINLVNDLLNVSRLETGTIQAVSEKVDLFDFLHPIVREASILSKETGRILQFHMSGSKIGVIMDAQLIGQVVTNLLSNAINYTDKGKVITISAEKNRVKKL